MSHEPATARKAFGDIAPALAEYTDQVLFGDVWQRPGLSPRDRSLATVACLVALYRINELPFHLKKALENGLSRDELIELITHLAFYSGWPTASSALPIARGACSKRQESDMDIQRNGSQPSSPGPAEYFTGTVRIDPLFSAQEPSRTSAASVTFEPGARSAWHTHPLGQVLIVTSGCGYVQSWGGPVRTIRPGDVVRCPPGEKHWHGAAPATAMTHIAIQEALDGKVVDWLEKVSDEQYREGSNAD